MKGIVLVLSCYLINVNVLAQISDDLGIHSQWVSALITFKNNESIEGLIQHNLYTGNIIYQDPSGEKIPINENRILSMEYSDPATGLYRVFYAFEFKDKETGRVDEMLFEIVKDFKNFAVLSKYLPATSLGNLSDNDDFDILASRKHGSVYGQAEIILFVGEEAELELYFILAYLKKDGLLFDQTKFKVQVVDKKLPKKYLKDYWSEVEAFMDENRFNLKSKRELFQVLDYYESLVEQE